MTGKRHMDAFFFLLRIKSGGRNTSYDEKRLCTEERTEQQNEAEVPEKHPNDASVGEREKDGM